MKTADAQSIRKRAQRGVGIIEILVALAIGLVLIAGIIQLFVSGKLTYQVSGELARIQENARYAMYVLAKDIRMAGYTGCATSFNNLLNSAGVGYDDSLYNLNQGLSGWEYTGTGPASTLTVTTLDPTGIALSNWNDQDGSDLPGGLQDRVVPGTDVLVVKRVLDPEGTAIKNNNLITTATINTVGASGLEQYEIVLVTEDCVYADLFQKRNVATATSVSRGVGASTNPGPGNINAQFSRAYDEDGYFMRLSPNLYYVGQGASGQPALFVRSYNLGSTSSSDVELVEGVENLQVLYGEDTDADGIANQYVTIDNVADPTQVVSARIGLLMRAIDAVGTDVDTSTYRLTGMTAATATTVDPIDDTRLRFALTATLKLRNKGVK